MDSRRQPGRPAASANCTPRNLPCRSPSFELAQAQAAARQAADTSRRRRRAASILKAPVNGFVLNVLEESARAVTPGIADHGSRRPHRSRSRDRTAFQRRRGRAARGGSHHRTMGRRRPPARQVTLVEPGGYTKFSALGVEEQRVKVRVDFLDQPPRRQIARRPLPRRSAHPHLASATPCCKSPPARSSAAATTG